MRKYQSVLHEDVRAAKGSRVPQFVLLVLVLLVSPVLYEFVLMLTANWQGMSGTYWVPRTPILDTMADWGRVAQHDLRLRSGRLLNGSAFSPSLIVPFALVWGILMGVVFLRKVR